MQFLPRTEDSWVSLQLKYEYLTNEHIKYDYDGIADEALAKKFGVTKEFAHEVMNFYYYPQIYYMSSSDFYE